MESVGLIRTDLAFCFGCLRCWTSGTGKCVSKDKMEELELKLPGRDLIIILSPVLFGTFSSTMKTVIDKGFGNKLTDTAKIRYPQLIIGYGDDVTDEEAACFVDLTRKHRGAADIVHPELSDVPVDVFITASMEQNRRIAADIEEKYLTGTAT